MTISNDRVKIEMSYKVEMNEGSNVEVTNRFKFNVDNAETVHDPVITVPLEPILQAPMPGSSMPTEPASKILNPANILGQACLNLNNKICSDVPTSFSTLIKENGCYVSNPSLFNCYIEHNYHCAPQLLALPAVTGTKMNQNVCISFPSWLADWQKTAAMGNNYHKVSDNCYLRNGLDDVYSCTDGSAYVTGQISCVTHLVTAH